jgi:amino acid transporter
MLFSYVVRAVYIESSAMFVRGGVYRVVKEAMGGTLAKLSVSALLFDYVLTGPISGVSAAAVHRRPDQRSAASFRQLDAVPVNATAAVVAMLITCYFWWRNTQGIHESSDDALRIMKVVTVMVVLMIGGAA